MTRKIIAIVFIFIFTSVAWAILGATSSRAHTIPARSPPIGSHPPGAHNKTRGLRLLPYSTPIAKQQDVVENG